MHAHTAAVLARSIDAGRRLRVRVHGTSMYPLLRAGDHVWIEQIGMVALRRGDVVTFWYNTMLVTHRLLQADHRGCTTKGDNCHTDDGCVAHTAVVGRVVALERRGYMIDLQRWRWRVCGSVVAWLSMLEAAVRIVPRAGVLRVALHAAIWIALRMTLTVEMVWFRRLT